MMTFVLTGSMQNALTDNDNNGIDRVSAKCSNDDNTGTDRLLQNAQMMTTFNIIEQLTINNLTTILTG